MILILTKTSVNKSFGNQYSLKFEKSYDFMDICFYLELQDIPKVEIKSIEPDEYKSKIYHTIVKSMI